MKSMNEFELGIKNYQQSEYAKARLYFEKALLHAENKKELAHNIELVKTKLHLEDIESNQDFLTTTLRTPLAFFFTLATFVLLLSVISYLRKKTTLFYTLSFFLFLLMAGVGFIKSQYYFAINLQEQNIYTGSSMAMPKNGKLPAGLKFIVKKKNENEWIFIESPKDFQGWVKNLQIERL